MHLWPGMKQIDEKEVYFHVGLGKTASKYLQYKVFPKFKRVYYIQRTRYKKCLDIIDRTNHKKYFVSNEFDQQLEREARWFSAKCPNAKIIVIFRIHDSWIASQYRRWVKNGYSKPFSSYFDIENDQGLWKQHELNYYDKLLIIEKYFKQKPLVLFYEDMRKDTFAFIDSIANVMGASYDKNSISLTPKHASYNEKQLKVFRKLARWIYWFDVPVPEQPVLKFLVRTGKMVIRYPLLYGALLVPKALINKEPLIPENLLSVIREKYAQDWKKVKEYAQKNNLAKA